MTPEGITYILRDDSIHDFTFHNMKYETLDLFYTNLENIFHTTSPNETVKLLLYSPQLGSIQYMATRGRQLRQKYPHLQKSRIAVLFPHALQVNLLNMAVRSLTRVSPVKLFQKDQTEQAVAWLMET